MLTYYPQWNCFKANGVGHGVLFWKIDVIGLEAQTPGRVEVTSRTENKATGKGKDIDITLVTCIYPQSKLGQRQLGLLIKIQVSKQHLF